MKSDKANTMECPFVARKCKGEKCIGWDKINTPYEFEGCGLLAGIKDFCSLINTPILTIKKEGGKPYVS